VSLDELGVCTRVSLELRDLLQPERAPAPNRLSRRLVAHRATLPRSPSAQQWSRAVRVLFKRQKLDRSRLLEVTREEEPKLFAFISRLAAKTGAPEPKHVYLSHEVNAAVFYDSSLLSLFWPVKKNLLVGLGLVNALNVTELTAVLAHELGHFGQGTMRVGSYVYVANRVLADLIWGRDAWDRLRMAWAASDPRIAWVAWIILSAAALLRRLLEALFRGLNFLHASLSRQMEFGADRVAVAVAGSDALCHGLLRASFADSCLSQTFRDLIDAGDHGHFTDDLFLHQSRAMDFLREREARPEWGNPPSLPIDVREQVQVFRQADAPPPAMWSSHPSNIERERNAKQRYVRSHFDERSAFVLFDDPAATRARVTKHLLELDPKRVKVVQRAAEEVQAFIDAEHEETTHDARYAGGFDRRTLNVEGLEATFEQAATQPAQDTEALVQELRELFGQDFTELAQCRKQLLEEDASLGRRLATGNVERHFEFRGRRHDKRDTSALPDRVGRELEGVMRRLGRFDKRMLRAHAAVAHALGESRFDELRSRYRFQWKLQEFAFRVTKLPRAFAPPMNFLASKPELDPAGVGRLNAEFEQVRAGLERLVADCRDEPLPVLRNMEDATSLGGFLLAERVVTAAAFSSNVLLASEAHKLAEQLAEVQDKLTRLIHKSVGAILELQEWDEAEWIARLASEAGPFGAPAANA